MTPLPEPLKRALPCVLVLLDRAGHVTEADPRLSEWTGRPEAELLGCPIETLFSEAPNDLRAFLDLAMDQPVLEFEGAMRTEETQPLPVLARLVRDASADQFFCVLCDQRTLKSLQFKLGQAQQMESVGRIAAGIAHEINTPIQFIGDSVSFLDEGFSDLLQLLEHFESLARAAERAAFEPELVSKLREIAEEADLDFLRSEVPASLERTREGVSRVAEIARAIKEFSYPDQREKEATDLNAALTNTLTIARNEYKYVADIETDLADLPPVFCHPGHLNQVFLNLIVNAAHAIEAANGDGEEKGTIRIRTRCEGPIVSIRIADTGCGIPDEIRTRVFDAFFTTKEVGRGTGQGLALARSVIVEKHGGTLSFDSEVGRGTCFEIRVPVDGRVAEHEDARRPGT